MGFPMRGQEETTRNRWKISGKGEGGQQEVRGKTKEEPPSAELYFDVDQNGHKLKYEQWIGAFFSVLEPLTVSIVLNSKHRFSQKEICNKAALQLHVLYQGADWNHTAQAAGKRGPRGESQRYRPPCWAPAHHSYDFLALKGANLLYKNVECRRCLHPCCRAVHKQKCSPPPRPITGLSEVKSG